MQKYDACLMASGGMDSTTLAYLLLNDNIRFKVIFINYGQHFIDTELGALKDVLPENIFRDIKILDISTIYSESSSPLIKKRDLWSSEVKDEMLYVPFRSLVMISAAMAYAQSIGIDVVYAAFIDSNFVKDVDATADFFERLKLTTDAYGSVELKLPLKNMTKLDIIKLGISVGAPIEKSFSCQINDKIPCGACPNCVDRENAITSWYMGEYEKL